MNTKKSFDGEERGQKSKNSSESGFSSPKNKIDKEINSIQKAEKSSRGEKLMTTKRNNRKNDSFDEAPHRPKQNAEQLGLKSFENIKKTRAFNQSPGSEKNKSRNSQNKSETRELKKHYGNVFLEDNHTSPFLGKSKIIHSKNQGKGNKRFKGDDNFDLGVKSKSSWEHEKILNETKSRGRKPTESKNKQDINKSPAKTRGKISNYENTDNTYSSSLKNRYKSSGRGKPDEKKSFYKKSSNEKSDNQDAIRLNKYLSNAGICSRREADKLIETGVVTVNGKVITELGFKVKPGDKVVYGGQRIKAEKKVYLLLNKPKDYITTTDDPQERRTVLDLVRGACKERIYPVGRLDRNTTGVLLLTNDGDVAKKLLHPKHGIAKVYHVTLDKNVSREDMNTLFEGVELEDGFVRVDNIAYASTAKSKKEVGVEIHSGKNRIVRRLFEHLGYKVVKLDRVSFAGLTKKDLPRGRYRFLSEKEISFLKMIS